jgi:hypothetical protein
MSESFSGNIDFLSNASMDFNADQRFHLPSEDKAPKWQLGSLMAINEK